MAVPAFQFPPSLIERHIEELKKRGITPEFAISSGVRTAADNELRTLGFDAALPGDEKRKGLQGLCFEYVDLETRLPATYRIKPDVPFTLQGGTAKYLSRAGDKIRVYFPHTTTIDASNNPKINVIITEGEFKTLAIAEKICPIASRETQVIGLQGVNGGWHRDKITATLPDGTKETRKEGHPHLIDDLEAWEWKKRVVYICFDSDVGSKAQAVEFKKSKRSGSWGAEYTLSLLLRARGADVRIVILPTPLNGFKYGADDYIAQLGAHDFLRLIYNNWVVERDVDAILYQPEQNRIRLEMAAALIARAPAMPPFVVDGLLPLGCLGMITAGTGVGKSLMSIALCHSVSTGGKFLDQFQCEKGTAIYIQTELPEWMVAHRLKAIGDLSPNFIVCNPGMTFPMNYWEPDGFNKRRETGNRERVMYLMEQIKSARPNLVVFDPLKDFSTISLTDPLAAEHVMKVFQMIAEYCKCAVMIVHHSRKIGGRNGTYEGSDDSYGAFNIAGSMSCQISIYTQTKADGTMRYKIVFSKTRCGVAIKPMELDRMSGIDSSGWSAIEWEGHTSVDVGIDQKILQALQDQGGLSYKEICDRAEIKKDSFYRAYEKLYKKGLVTKRGNVYYMCGVEE